MLLGRQLHGRRGLHRQLQHRAGSPHDRDQRIVGDRSQGGAPQRQQLAPGRQPGLGLVCLGGQLRGRRELPRQLGQLPGASADRVDGNLDHRGQGFAAGKRQPEPDRFPPVSGLPIGRQLHGRGLVFRQLERTTGPPPHGERRELGGRSLGAAPRQRRLERKRFPAFGLVRIGRKLQRRGSVHGQHQQLSGSAP